ncbi:MULTISPECIES: hypothetical protein [Flavobacterium]|uniref:Dihydrolipoamide dehydrogenase n=1 Tax=Flavobacterium ranwuense TaxID=2541725 RepID=A0ABY2DQI1_9FLAO|nr:MULTISPECIES: hypothetical protein [Flavobacterium]TDE26799.1 hypothetical protein E0I61_16140 [Flavobacterium ranwuense]TDE54428.1 hypothetical protein E0H99_06200 [Flavobacterium sp. GT3P67]
MKKIISLLAVIGITIFSSCEGPEGIPGQDGQDGLIAEVIEVTNVSFSSSNNFTKTVLFDPPIFESDVVLVYRLTGVFQGKDVWKLLPETHYSPSGTLNFGFDFDFTVNDVDIYLVGNDLSTVPNEFKSNQVLRIIIVPGSFSKTLNTNNYAEVIKALNINESQIQKINF